jgi:cellulose synthase/poly-beta-1,6-N-acetylglucosamine synthase-like glycosyltransferase
MVALRTMTPDFETGDLQISVNLMKQGLRIGFLPDITVKTTVPASISEYFHQRRRWERGTIKVLWKDRSFYGSSFRAYRILALLTIIHLSIYVGITYLAIVAMLYEDALSLISAQIIIVGIFWYVINMVKLFSNSKIRNSAFALKVPVWAMWNGVVWLFITSPARIFGCVEAISQLRAEARSNI